MKVVTIGKIYHNAKVAGWISFFFTVLFEIFLGLYWEFGEGSFNDFMLLYLLEIMSVLILGVSVGLYCFIKSGLKHKIFTSEQIIP